MKPGSTVPSDATARDGGSIGREGFALGWDRGVSRIGVVRLNKELPERTALRQLLYGDPGQIVPKGR